MSRDSSDSSTADDFYTSASSCLNRGIDLVTKATEEDKAKNYELAVTLYERGVRYLIYERDYKGHSKKSRESITAKCKSYSDRVEKLKNYLQSVDLNPGEYSDGSSEERREESDGDNSEEVDTKILRRQLTESLNTCMSSDGDATASGNASGDVCGASGDVCGASGDVCGASGDVCGASGYLQRGIDSVTKGTEEDKGRNYELALTHYIRGIKCFIDAMKYEAHSDQAKESIRAKSLQFLDRAEKIETYLKSDNKAKSFAGSSNIRGDESDDDNTEDGETRILRRHISETIVKEKPNVKWDDVAGLDVAKELLQNAAILPIESPHLFSGNKGPYKSILLYGPPGIGKSYLAKAVATEANNSTFFSVSSSNLISKWLGESEKLIKSLFTMARERRPSIIFFDDFDFLCSNDRGYEIEELRRRRAEFLLQMQRLGDSNSMDGILVLAATSVPWALNSDVMARFEKRIYISLPEAPARTDMFHLAIGKTRHELTPRDFQELGKMTEGYSGADINVLVRDALMQPVRKVQTATHFRKVSGPSKDDPSVTVHDLLEPCAPLSAGAIEMNWTQIDGETLWEPLLSMNDLKRSLQSVKPTIRQDDLGKFLKFTVDLE